MRRSCSTKIKPLDVVRTAAAVNHRAFTLVELLVVIKIMLVLVAVTVASFNFSINADRMRAGARQVQSFLVGARDKAIYAKEIRGVRLLLDPNDNHSVNAVQYIGSPQREVGTLTIDSTGFVVTFSSGTLWYSTIPTAVTLSSQGLLRVGCLIQIPRDTGAWYTVSATNFGPSASSLILSRPIRDFAGSSASYPFVLQLAPGVLGDAQPVVLPRGVVIDLDGSNVPSTWRPSPFSGSYSTQMDILFTPRGTVVGDCLTLGILHLHFADAGDVLTWHQIAGRNTNPVTNPTGFAVLPFVPVDDPTVTTSIVKRDRILTSLATRTGSVSVHYVFTQNTTPPTPPNPSIAYQNLAFDPYVFAETGQVANK